MQGLKDQVSSLETKLKEASEESAKAAARSSDLEKRGQELENAKDSLRAATKELEELRAKVESLQTEGKTVVERSEKDAAALKAADDRIEKLVSTHFTNCLDASSPRSCQLLSPADQRPRSTKRTATTAPEGCLESYRDCSL